MGRSAATVLASLLPGLREVRAPLAAGYLWLIVAWLLLHDRIEKGSSAPGAVDALAELRDAIGLGGVAAAATFVAYLLGALWEPISVGAAKLLWSARIEIVSWPRRRKEWVWMTYKLRESDFSEPTTGMLMSLARRGEAGRRFFSYTPPRSFRISSDAWRRLWLIGQRLFDEVDETLTLRLHPSDEPDSASHVEDLTPLLDRVVEGYVANLTATAGDRQEELAKALRAFDKTAFGSIRDMWWTREAADFTSLLVPPELYLRLNPPVGRPSTTLVATKEAGKHLVLLGEAEVTDRLFSELPHVARRLVGEQQELFLEASRMKGEVEFRHALALPLPIAFSVVTFGLGAPTWVWIAASVAGVLAGWGLLADGWRRDELRNDYLVELLAIGRAKSPTFERLLERARQVAPAVRGGPVDEAGASEVWAGAVSEESPREP